MHKDEIVENVVETEETLEKSSEQKLALSLKQLLQLKSLQKLIVWKSNMPKILKLKFQPLPLTWLRK